MQPRRYVSVNHRIYILGPGNRSIFRQLLRTGVGASASAPLGVALVFAFSAFVETTLEAPGYGAASESNQARTFGAAARIEASWSRSPTLSATTSAPRARMRVAKATASSGDTSTSRSP